MKEITIAQLCTVTGGVSLAPVKAGLPVKQIWRHGAKDGVKQFDGKLFDVIDFNREQGFTIQAKDLAKELKEPNAVMCPEGGSALCN